ncbi:MAG: DUF1592 domain-containing protein [Planctomycetaceae bacterium]|jgi:hypothetical protein|nr:DUF1592 domain-containing protein [Planctomycetaceae bacterium]
MARLRVCLLLPLLVVGCGSEQIEDPTIDRAVAELESHGSADGSLVRLAEEYPERILPLVQKHCLKCHSHEKKKGGLDLGRFRTVADVGSQSRTWQKVLRRLRDGEMPPRDSQQPSPADRERLIEWSENYLLADARDRAGDPGLVLMRRLTKAEYNYSVRDLTGVDLRPARRFLEDSVAGEGFANTGESLFMAPELLPKYLDAARQVSAHAVLTPTGVRFSPSRDRHDWIAEAAQRIKDFYSRYTDRKGRLPLADYLKATLRYRDGDRSADLSLEEFASQQGLVAGRTLSPKYLRLLWESLNERQPAGEMAEVVRQWRDAKTIVVKGVHDAATRIEETSSSNPGDPKTFQFPPVAGAFGNPEPYGVGNVTGKDVDAGFIWNPGSHFVVDFGKAKQIKQVRLWSGYGGAARGATMQVAFSSQPAGPFTVPEGGEFNYLTSSGGGVLKNGEASPDFTGSYHYEFQPATARYWRIAMVGVTSGHMPRTTTIQFGPMPDVVAPGLLGTISSRQARLWKFNSQTNHLIGSLGLFGSHIIPLTDGAGKPKRNSDTYSSFAGLFPRAVCFAPVVPVNTDMTVELFLREDEPLSRLVLDKKEREQLDRLWDELHYLSREPVEVLYNTREFIGFQPADRIENTNKFAKLIPSLQVKAKAFEKSATTAEPRHLDAVIELATRAWRRSLSEAETGDLRDLYQRLRRKQELSHDAAIRTMITRVLVSPNFLYRIERSAPGEQAVTLSDWELASRLSYFLWSSMPDDQLRTAASDGGLQDEAILTAEANRMRKNPKARALAIEFAGQWLQFRGFDQYDGKSETRFPTFTTTLRMAMNREAIEFVSEIIRNDRSILELLQADYTFLNDELAAHYGIPNVEGPEFRRVAGVGRFGRGGIATMGSVLTKQAGALRTSPVLRGTWVVETLLGRRVPNPPDDVPELEEDEVNKDGLTMRQLLERHSADASCVSCHAKIDPYGFALEAYDPIGRLRERDLNGNPIDARAEPQDEEAFEGITGLQSYLLEHEDEFTKQFCRKLLGYALGRSVELSDEALLAEMQAQLKTHDYRFSTAMLTLVKSSQFRRHRGQNDPGDISR